MTGQTLAMAARRCIRNTYFGTALAFEWLVHVPLGTGVEESQGLPLLDRPQGSEMPVLGIRRREVKRDIGLARVVDCKTIEIKHASTSLARKQ